MNELTAAHMAGEQRLRELAAAGVGSAWERLAAYDRENVAPFVAAAVAVVLAAQRQSAALTNAYLARVLRARPAALDYAAVTGAAVRAGALPADVYARPFVTVWTALKAGRPYEDAVAAGFARAQGLAATDVQLSMRATAAAIGEANPHIYGYRRVTDGNACALCQIASTQRYHRGALMPIHANCGCTVEPITEPTGQVIDRELLGKLKAEGAIDKITRQRQARRARAIPEDLTAEVREHGELGPVLVNADHHFDLVA